LQREKADYEQHLLIKDIFHKRNRKAGWRVIKMVLERQGIIMNHKKKYGLVTQIRRCNPYKFLARATQEHRMAPNMLQRKFDLGVPYRAFGTDITYLYNGNGQRSYLSVIEDYASGEIVAHRVSASLGVELSLDVIRQLVLKVGRKTLKEAMVHSDQGVHYTNPFYSQELISNGIVQSMSRRGNCLDNAPVESFFGHMKDELDLASCASLTQVKTAVSQYIHNYNHHRYQWERKKMAPVEYRNHLLAG
jgi:putative transposase